MIALSEWDLMSDAHSTLCKMPTAVTDPQPPLALLDPTAHPTKTIDFGAAGVSCSLSTHGRLLTSRGTTRSMGR